MARPDPSASLAGSLRLFQVAGISVFVHWSWLLVAVIALRFRAEDYTSQVWNIAEYLSLFAIVLLHEFGHALACRSVGGTADQIVLWPLGGIAFVNPPPRPGALLWSIAAGPLVNAVLAPPTIALAIFLAPAGWPDTRTDVHDFIVALTAINLVLLIFNMLPIYPLDGGQMLQAILWFFIGQANSLLVVSVVGMVVGVVALGLLLYFQEWWLALLAAFIALRSWAGFQQARVLARLLCAPRHDDAACPKCGNAPIMGDYWGCAQCQQRFDMIEHRGVCPNCSQRFPLIPCPACRQASRLEDWFADHEPGWPTDRWETRDSSKAEDR